MGPARPAQPRHGHTQVRPRLRRGRRGGRRRGRGGGRVDVLRAARAVAARAARRARGLLPARAQADAPLRPAALGAAAAVRLAPGTLTLPLPLPLPLAPTPTPTPKPNQVLRVRALGQGLLAHRAVHALPHPGLPVLPRHARRRGGGDPLGRGRAAPRLVRTLHRGVAPFPPHPTPEQSRQSAHPAPPRRAPTAAPPPPPLPSSHTPPRPHPARHLGRCSSRAGATSASAG